MTNLRKKLEDIHGLIDQMRGSANVANRYVLAKSLKAKIDLMIAELIAEENEMLSEDLRSRYKK